MKHFSFLFFLLILLAHPDAYSQQAADIPPPSNDYTALIDSLISNLDKSRIPTSILYDRVVGLSGLDSHTTTTSSSGSHFFQSYLDLSTAAYSESTSLFPYTQAEMHATVAEQIRAGRLPLGMLDVRFAVLDTLAEERGTIVESGGLYYDGAASPYQSREITLIAPLADTIGSSIAFTLPSALLLRNTTRRVSSVEVRIDGVAPFTLRPGGSYNVVFNSGGIKNITFRASFSDGVFNRPISARAQLYVKPNVGFRPTAVSIQPISPNIIGHEWTDYFATTTYGEGEAKSYLLHPQSKTDGKLRNVVVILDGYDPGNERDISAIANEVDPLLQVLEKTAGKERDVVFLNFLTNYRNVTNPFGSSWREIDGGADFVERNALVLVELLNRLKPLMADPTQKVTVVGPSMGGLISRYALALMEKNYADTSNPSTFQNAYWQHNVDTWISFDAPHGGANIPMGDQHFLNFFAGVSDGAYTNMVRLRSAAAQQMLIHHNLSSAYSSYRLPFMRNLVNNGLPGSSGFPTQLRRVSIADGSLKGALNANIGATCQSALQLDVVRNRGNKQRRFFYRSTEPGTQIAANVYFSPSANQGCTVFNGESRVLVALFKPIAKRYIVGFSSGPNGSYDLAPGGTYDSQLKIKEAALSGNPLPGYSFRFTGVRPFHSFIPTVSALAFQYRNTASYDGTSSLPNPYTNLSTRRLICDDETPFDAFYAEPQASVPHVTLSSEAQQFLVRELFNISQPVQFAASNASTFCENTTTIVELTDCVARPGNTEYDWSLTGPAVFATGTTTSANGGVSQSVLSTGAGQIAVSVVARRLGLPPSPASSYSLYSSSEGYARLHDSSGGQDVCIGSLVTVQAEVFAGAHVVNWRVEDGDIEYIGGNEVGIRVRNSTGITTVYADLGSSCPGSGSASVSATIHVVDQTSDGFLCPFLMRTGTPEPALYPNPADTYVDLRSPFAVAKPYQIEIYNDRGKRVHGANAKASSVRVDTHSLPTGLYHLTVRQGKESVNYNLNIRH